MVRAEGADRSEPERKGPAGLPVREDACVDRCDERDVALVASIQGWDVPRMAYELRKVAKDSGEDVAAHRGLVKIIPQWEQGDRPPASGAGCCTSRSSRMRSAACRRARHWAQVSRCGSPRSARTVVIAQSGRS